MKIKTTIVCILSLYGFLFWASAQPNPFVNTNPHHQACVLPTDIDENLLADIVEQKSNERNRRIGRNSYTIPIVFHILHKNGLENIEDDQVYSALDILNQDFNSGNADLVQVPAPFAGIIGNATIQFALAQQAPDGSCTNGINRYYSGFDTTYNYFWTDDGQYYLNTIKAEHYWDTDKYLNIYVVNQSYNSGLAFFPYQVEAKANAGKWLDGIMIRHYNLGNIGTAKHNGLPHVLSHEVGHYLDLMHIWGNWFYPGSSQLSWKDDCNYKDALCPDFYCHSDDMVNDTPNTEYQFSGCIYQSNTCGSADNATNIMGYGCELMFTEGQVKRMHRTLNSTIADRNNIWSQANLDYTLRCSGTTANINCKKLYSSFVNRFSIVSNNTGYILHYLNGINNKVRYRINHGAWVEFPVSDSHFYTVNEILACATYEFQISEQCDTLFSPWSASKFFYTNDASLPEANTITPINSMNCFETDTIQDCSQLQLSFQVNHQTHIDTVNGSAEAIVFGGTSPYEIQWSTGAQSPLITDLSPGYYHVSVSDSLGCMQKDSIQILGVLCDNFQLNVNSTNETYFNANNGTAFAEINGGLPPYHYQWSNGYNFASQYSLSPAVYSVIVEDRQGCSAIDSIRIEAVNCDSFNFVVSTTHQSYYQVNDGVATAQVINGTPPYTYYWSTGDTLSSIENVAPGSYSVSIVDALACQLRLPFQIDSINCLDFNMAIETLDASNTQISDGAASVTLTGGNPPYQYFWSTGDTISSLNNLSTGNYTITTIDSLGCQLTEQILINSFICDSIHLDFTIFDETYFEANDGSAMALATGGTAPYSYTWSTGDTTQTINNLMPGVYWLSVQDSLNCATIDSLVIQAVDCQNLAVDVNPSNETYVDANDGSIMLEVSGGHEPYVYQWSTGDTTAHLSNLTPAIYYFTLTDSLGCFLKDSITINAIDCSSLEVSPEVTHETYNHANDGMILLNISGGQVPFHYQWSTSDTTTQLTNLAPATYSFQITDHVGCTLVDSIEVRSVECSMLSVEVIQKEVTCAGDDDGSLFIAGIMHVNEPYKINWSNGVSSDINDNLVAGTYTLVLTDDIGCRFEAAYEVKEGTAIAANTVITPASSFQTPDASIDLSVTSGTPPYQYYWSNGTIEEDVYDIFAGNYWLSITDSLNCNVTLTNIEVGIAENCPYNVVETPSAFAQDNVVRAQHMIQSNRRIHQGDSLHYTAGNSINLENDFQILKGATFEAKIDDCGE